MLEMMFVRVKRMSCLFVSVFSLLVSPSLISVAKPVYASGAETVTGRRYVEVGTYSENGLAWAKDQQGLYGYIDQSGEAVVEFKYIEAGDFNSIGLARVKGLGGYGYINKLGVEVIPTSYTELSKFYKSGYCRSEKDSLFNFISPYGIEEYLYVRQRGEYYIAIKDGKHIVCDKYGEVVSEGTTDGYINAYDDGKGPMIVKIDDKYYLTDEKGTILSKPYDGIKNNNTRNSPIICWDDGKYGLIDSTGTELITPSYDSLYKASYSLYFKNADRAGILDFRGNLVFQGDLTGNSVPSILGDDDDDYYCLRKEDDSSYLSRTDSNDEASRYDRVEIRSGYFALYGDGKSEIMLYDGLLFSDFSFNSTKPIEIAGEHYIALFGNNVTRVYDPSFIDYFEIIESDICDITVADDYFIYKKSENQKYGASLIGGDICLPPEYDSLEFFGEESFIFSVNGYYGIISMGGDILLPVVYDSLEYNYYSDYGDYRSNKYMRATMNGKMGIIDKNGNVVVPFSYDLISNDYTDGYGYLVDNTTYFLSDLTNLTTNVSHHIPDTFIVKKEGLSGIVDLNGTEVIPPIYDLIVRIAYDDNGIHGDRDYYAVKSGSLYGIIDSRGDFLLPIEYSFLSNKADSRILYAKSGVGGQDVLLDVNGNKLYAKLIKENSDGFYAVQFENGSSAVYYASEGEIKIVREFPAMQIVTPFRMGFVSLQRADME